MIFYTDKVKNKDTTKVAIVRFFNVKTETKSWNSGKYIDIIDAELFAIEKTIEYCAKNAKFFKIASNIWIFTDSANAITRLQKVENQTHLMQKLQKNCKLLYELDYKIHIHWISKHSKISENVKADEQAKKDLKMNENRDNFMLF